MPQPKVIVIFSTKGGVGKTFFATNLAATLSKEEGQKVLLVDFDLQVVSDMSRMLDAKPEKAIVDIINLLEKNAQQITKEDFLIRTKFMADFLPAVLRMQQSPHIKPDKIKQVFDLFRGDYDYIIVDAGHIFGESIAEVLNQANIIFLVVTPDILSIYQARLALEVLQSLRFPLKMIRIILNRAEATSSLSWQEVAVSLPCEIITQIPSEGKSVLGSVNRCLPVVIESPRSRVAKAFKKFAKALLGQSDVFVEHKDIDETLLKELRKRQPGEFWEAEGMKEALLEPKIEKEMDELIRLKTKIHERLIADLNLKRLDFKVFSDRKKTEDLRERAQAMITNFLLEEGGKFISSSEMRKSLVKEIMDEVLGLGPLEDLLADQEITDIMVNNKDEIYIERHGKIELTKKSFISNDQVRTIIERIIAPIGRHIDESVPMVDARLPDGSRVNAIIPPLALTGPTLTIRKFRKEKMQIQELIDLKTLNSSMAEFIKACVLTRKNIIVSGGTGSGKTTILNALSSFIPENERIVTIEDAAELKLHQEHWVRMESRPPNIEGRGEINIRDLFRNCLRMRPDRIIIGECRAKETLDMLQAMNTGHDGSMTTLHANSTRDVLTRMDSLILMSGVELPIRAIREMVASAIDIIVHTARLSDGSRKIIQITEIAGMRDETNINLKDIFTFDQTGVDKEGKVLGGFKSTGYIPSAMQEIKVKGIPISEDIFMSE